MSLNFTSTTENNERVYQWLKIKENVAENFADSHASAAIFGPMTAVPSR